MPRTSTDDSLISFWSIKTEDALAKLRTSEKGLSSAESAVRLQEYGFNTLKQKAGASSLMLLLLQFKSPITLLLISAALLSMGLGDFTDAVIILVIIFVSSFLGFWQENGAANAVTELLKMVQIRCRIVRDEKPCELPIEDAVPGDIIILSAGDMVPADSLLLEAEALFIDEAAFSGETYPVEKSTGVIATDATLSQRTNSLFMGSHVISGKAKALVVKTGKQTAFGKISDRLYQNSRNRL